MNVQNQIDQLIALRAAQWYEQMKDEPEAGERARNAEFVQWLAESPRHMESFMAIAAQAPFIRKALARSSLDLPSLLQTLSPEIAQFPDKGLELRAVAQNAPRHRGPLWRWAFAAAIVAAAIGVPRYSSYLSWQRFETPAGEQRTIQLKEGSIVNLNASSHIEVRFDERGRNIRLTRGEATFKVTPDPAHPFRVHTAGAVVEAVGTQFNVYARMDGTTAVAVLEGKVKVTGEHGQSAELAPLAAGDEATVNADGRVELEKHPDITEAVAWQQRKLIFKRTSLNDMAMEFNRYNQSTQIRLDGIEAGRFRYSGAFNADDPQSLATLLEHEPDLTVERRPHEIVIRPKDGSQPR